VFPNPLPQARKGTCGRCPRIGLVGVMLLVVLSFGSATKQGGIPSLAAQEKELTSELRPELSLGLSGEYDYDPPEPGSYRLPVIKPAQDGVVLNLNGRQGKLREMLKGRITVLSFIYTRCADPRACPYATGVLYKVHSISEQDPVIGENLRLVTFSFDPEYDTPRVLSTYTRALRKSSGADWLFLTTASHRELAPILQGYGQQVDRRKNLADPLGPYSHLLRVYLIDRQGMIRNIYSSGMLDPRLVLTDVRTLLLEERVLEAPAVSGSTE
jgi:cytochrome oxidase Cu insertion factor (SCO1/SenC/PrrC family)